MSIVPSPPNPPKWTLQPLHILDEMLSSIQRDDDDDDDDGTAAIMPETSDNLSSNKKDQKQQQQQHHQPITQLTTQNTTNNNIDNRRLTILRVVDFLYGNSGSILDSTLSLLDAESHVRLFAARPSGREVIIVRGSSTAANASVPFLEYICFAGYYDGDDEGKGRNYCSCRAFYEKSKQGHCGVVCKHLLAAKLAPYLVEGFKKEEVSDGEFSLLIRRAAAII